MGIINKIIELLGLETRFNGYYSRTNKLKEENNNMMEFKTKRSIDTFIDNCGEFNRKFKVRYQLKDMRGINWMVNGATLYFWSGEANTDPQFNFKVVHAYIHDDITVIEIQDPKTDQKFSMVFDNVSRKKQDVKRK